MKLNIYQISILFILIFILASCITQSTSTIVGGEYDAHKNRTDYFVIPYGSVSIPDKWDKVGYNKISHQQYFRSKDSVLISVAFGPYNKYEFNTKGIYTGYNFVKAYYAWDSSYFKNKLGLLSEIIEKDSVNNYLIYRTFGDIPQGKYDTFFLLKEQKGCISLFTITATNKWTEQQKLVFLRQFAIKNSK